MIVLDLLVPLAAVLLVCLLSHRLFKVRLLGYGLTKHIKEHPASVISGIVAIGVFGIMSVTLLGPIGPGQAKEPLLVPFQTIIEMSEDCINNGIIDTEFLNNWNGSIINVPYIIRHSARNLAANVLLFVPVGFVAGVHVKRIRLGAAAIISAVVPIAVELWQLLLCRGRTCDIDDVILNFIGIFIGFAVVIIYRNRSKNGKRNNRRNKQINNKEA